MNNRVLSYSTETQNIRKSDRASPIFLDYQYPVETVVCLSDRTGYWQVTGSEQMLPFMYLIDVACS